MSLVSRELVFTGESLKCTQNIADLLNWEKWGLYESYISN